MASAQWERIQPSPCVVLVSNLATNVTAEKLKEFIEFCGEIEDLELCKVDSDQQHALVIFKTPVAANTATMLTKARLNDKVIEVSYYFPQFNGSSAPESNTESRDYHANKMVSEWLAKGMLLTEQGIANGRGLLERYGVMQKIDQARVMAASQAAKLDEQYHLKEKALGVDQKFQLTSRLNAAKDFVVSTASQLHQTAIQHPIGKQANELLTKTAKTVDATLTESRKLYDSQKQQQIPPHEPVD